ncbi:unnamed protein product [Rotaria sordida]|uniref:Reverse transcriptase domain-containing protein n=1 Tax=Rotaria sordida TaxID=392033 RepID=A0A815K6B9_9BILA|nr:unnamed protein product [Rotaria sordida]
MHRTGRRRHAAIILFDIKAAFDSVWHDGLIYKLNDLGLPPYLMNYLISFLQNRTAAIEMESTLSTPFNLNSGTPQGSPLSLLLYIIYTADSMNEISDHTEHGLFADDIALWTSSNTISSLSFSWLGFKIHDLLHLNFRDTNETNISEKFQELVDKIYAVVPDYDLQAAMAEEGGDGYYYGDDGAYSEGEGSNVDGENNDEEGDDEE